MRNNAVPRKDLQKIPFVNWSRFTAETIAVSNSVLITGVNHRKLHRPGRGVLRGIRKP
ncbi:MAG: hypothetical protein ACLSG5_11745 [Oscillospiraceae bacterium]